MKRILLALAGVFFINTAQGQELSYGLVLGGNFYETNNGNGRSSIESKEKFKANLGGYAEYNFTDNIGVKTEITYTSKNISTTNTGPLPTTDFEFNYIEVSPAFKYDFGDEYRKGFYMTLGPRFSFMTSAKSQGEDVKELFEKVDIGLQLGLGQRLLQYFDLQAKLDYGATPFFQIKELDAKSSFFGAYVSLNLDLERMINKN